MKLKTLALMAATAVGFNANALDVTGYSEIRIPGIGQPTLLSDYYYSNKDGFTYRIDDEDFELLYQLDDAILINISGSTAIGYDKDGGSYGGKYFTCNINSCASESSREYSSIKGYSTDLYSPGMQAPYLRTSQSLMSGFGYSLVFSAPSITGGFNAHVIDNNGNSIESFPAPTVENISFGFLVRYLSGITGVTKEENFKLLINQSDSVSLMQWNTMSKQLETIQLYLNDGSDFNAAYPNGVDPIIISNPITDETGETTYRVVLSEKSDNDKLTTKNFLWGSIQVTDEGAVFTSEVNSSSASLSLSTGILTSGNPLFVNKSLFTFDKYQIDFSENGEIGLSTLNVKKSNKPITQSVTKVSSNGRLLLKDSSGYFLAEPSGLGLTTSSLSVDPYVNPEFNITLSTLADGASYFGLEANCSLQTTNAIVDSNDYIALSETALQIPIEWDSLTGEWKGAQSLTGLDSVSGSKEFAQFGLTADVTTGTWSMNCSGIASDIEGNKIELNPAEITINLDDQIHGGANVISGQITIPNTSDYSGVVVTITLNGRQIEVTTSEDGTFEFDRLVEGDYTVHVYSDQYVAACTDLTLSSENTNPVLAISMYAGDINNDGAVDIGDFSYLSSLYGLNSEDENYDALADLNHDGLINVQDLSILGSHFGTDHCEVSPQ